MTIKTENSLLWVHRILVPILVVIITGVVSFLGWLGTRALDRIEEGFKDHDGRLGRLEISGARLDSLSFTAQHWADAKARIDEDRANLDRRVTRLEEAIPAIKETLLRIEGKVDKLQDR